MMEQRERPRVSGLGLSQQVHFEPLEQRILFSASPQAGQSNDAAIDRAVRDVLRDYYSASFPELMNPRSNSAATVAEAGGIGVGEIAISYTSSEQLVAGDPDVHVVMVEPKAAAAGLFELSEGGVGVAAVVDWDGGGDGVSWSDARNWSGDVLPG